MDKSDALMYLGIIMIIVIVARDPSIIGAFGKDVVRASSYVGSTARESFRG